MDIEQIVTTTKRKTGLAGSESTISGVILILLIITGILIYLQQFRYDENIFDALVMQTGQTGPATGDTSQDEESLKIAGIEPEGLAPMSAREFFDPNTLSDKIDGKADGYLEAGFVSLVCRRFVKSSDREQWFEFFLYDMGLPRNAFSVYSKQKREGVTEQDFTNFAYSTENAVFFVHDKFYIEILAALGDDTLVGDMILMAKNFIAKYSSDSVALPELEYLPAEDLDIKSISLISQNAFGFSKFDHIFTGTYEIEDQKILAFVSIRESPEDAQSLAMEYDNLLSEFIGEERLKPVTDQIPGLKIVDLFGEYEMFFAKGNIIAGIHAAPDKKLGEEVAFNLYKKISELVE